MTEQEILSDLSLGEDSRRQFKIDLLHAEQAAAEFVAFLNSGGGRIWLGVRDEGSIAGLDAAGLRRLNQLLANAATHNVRPPCSLRTYNLEAGGKLLLLVEVPDGLNKPYCDNEGRFWVKNGPDKRKVTSPEELQRLFQAGAKLFADEQPMPETTLEDVDLAALALLYKKKTGANLESAPLPLGRLLEALGMAKRGALSLAGLLLVGRNVERHAPLFHVAAAAVPGADLGGTEFTDRGEFRGRLAEQYSGGMAFLERNLRHLAEDDAGFNQPGRWEVPREALQEILVNALVHRDYFANASVKLFIFADRVEIQSPGGLPNNLTVDSARLGVSVPRNSVLLSHAQFVLPYSGLGSGLPRALKLCPALELVNDTVANRVIVRFPRSR